jgi:hypothetical protein
MTRFFLARKQDFVIENKKRGGASTTGTKTSNVSTRTGNTTIVKSNAMEESQAGTETINATDTMMSSSAQPETGTIMEAEAVDPPTYQPTIHEEPREKEPFINDATSPTMDAIVDLEQGFDMTNGVPEVIAQEIVPTQEASYIPVGTEQDDGDEEELTMQESLQAMQHF